MTWFFVNVFLFSCPCFYLCQHKTFISLPKNNKCKLSAQHKMFSCPPRKSTALSVFSHKMNSLLGLHSGRWWVNFQCILHEAIISLCLEEKRLSLEEGSLVLFVFQWCWERQGHGNSCCSGKGCACAADGRLPGHPPQEQDEDKCPPYSSPSFPGDCTHSGTKVWKWGGKQNPEEPDLQKTPMVMKCGRLKD